MIDWKNWIFAAKNQFHVHEYMWNKITTILYTKMANKQSSHDQVTFKKPFYQFKYV